MNHYRTGINNYYLASEDLTDANNEFSRYNLTIKEVKNEINKFGRRDSSGGVAVWKIAYFLEKKLPNGVETKPMVINAVENLRKMANGTNTPDMNLWRNIKVVIGVKTGLTGKIGGKNGLRIMKVEIKPALPENKILKAIENFKKTGSIEYTKQHYSLTQEQEERITEKQISE